MATKTGPILNYTTTVPVNRTIGVIHEMLAKAGALQIATRYSGDGQATGVMFSIETAHGTRGFTLPINVESTRRVMGAHNSGVPPRLKTPEQAQRVAWRIAKDWLEAQLALVRVEMVTLDQVMLPYMRALDGRTVYELYLDDQVPVLAVGED